MSVKIVIRAAPEDVWRVMGDGFGEMHLWAGGAVESCRIDAEAPGVGVARISRLTKPVLGQDTVTERLTAWDPPRSYSYELDTPPPGFTAAGNTWSFSAHPKGTLVTVEPFADSAKWWGPLALWMTSIVLRPTVRRMVADVERLAAQR